MKSDAREMVKRLARVEWENRVLTALVAVLAFSVTALLLAKRPRKRPTVETLRRNGVI